MFANSLNSSQSYNLVWIIVGVFTAIESVKGGIGWLSRRIIRNKNVDDLLAARQQIAEVDKKISPNGKNTNNVGDVTLRTEEKLDGFIASFERHRNSVNRRLRALEKQAGTAK